MESIPNLGNLQDIYHANELGWDAVGLFLILLLLAGLSHIQSREWLNYIPHRRGRVMRRARRDYVRTSTIDEIVNVIEERVYQGTYTREEAKELYRDLKKCFPVRDFFPNPEVLKDNIKKRRASGIHAPVALPGSEKKEVKKAFSRYVKT